MPVHERSEKEYFTRRRDNWVLTKVPNVATRLRFENILYATDLSFAAERALPYALEIARRYGATIYVVHVIQPDVYPLVPPSAWSKMAETEAVFREESKRDLEEQLQSVPHEIIFRPGKTWPILSQLIEEKQIDLVVFSTHGGGGLQKLIFGSVADDIFRSSPCPILAVGPSVRIKPRANAELNRILYATDFKTESLAAAPYAISLAQEHRAQLVLLHSIEDGGDVSAILHTLKQLVPFGAELRTDPVCIVERGAPASKILEVAEAHGADLIMLGIQNNIKNFGKHLLRPGIFQIVAGATCPILMVRR
jgi:nucleotide-binding universal stress UspA family protein